MKTQVIQLDRHDDVISIRDKMSWTKVARILLVFPRRTRIRLRALDLHLLYRHAVLLGAQLAIVTRSADIRRAAQDEGLPVFRVVTTAQRKTWEKQHSPEKPRRRAAPIDLWHLRSEIYSKEAHWRNLSGVRIPFFTLAVLAVLVLILLFIPSATIRLTPTTHLQGLTISVSASPKVGTVNLTGSIPAHLTSTIVQKMKTAAVTGSVAIPVLKATGKVRFRNLTSGAVEIPAGTILRTTGNPPVRFATTMDAVMSAPAGKVLELPVQAVAGGASGNLPADALVAIEGDLGASLAVTNPVPMTGGTDREVPAPSTGDRTHLHDALQAEILSECKTTIQKNLSAGDLYFPDTLIISQVISEAYFPAANQTGDTLSLTLNLQCQLQYASAADINTLAEMAMDVNIPKGFEPTQDGVIASVAGVPKTDTDGITHWEMKAQRLLRSRLEWQVSMQLAQGHRPAEVARRLADALPLAASPEIKINPPWWPWLPVFPFRITVLISG